MLATKSANRMSVPRLAATVMLARAAAPGFELYMTRRSERSSFAADAFVFPGGTVEPQDYSEHIAARTLGLEAQRMAAEFRATVPAELPSEVEPIDSRDAAALLNAALREAFEEAGILPARTRAGDAVEAPAMHAADVQTARAAIVSGGLTFAEFLERHDWFADARSLTFFSHWITPPSEPRRFNTHFFLAPAPPGQAGLADAVETHEGRWIAPRAALERYRAGQFRLVYPTIKHLERLASFESLDDALAFARAKPVLTILPARSANGFTMPAPLEDAW